MKPPKKSILSFSEYTSRALSEQNEDPKDPPTRLEQYRMIAVCTRMAFDLYRQFFSLIDLPSDKADEKLTNGLNSIRSENGMKDKWDRIVGLGKEFQGEIDDFSSKKSRGVAKESPFHYMDLDFTGQDSKNLLTALEKLKVASELSTKGMSNDKLRRRNEILDQVLNPSSKLVRESMGLTQESIDLQIHKLWEGNENPPPPFATLKALLDQLDGQVLNLRGSLRNIESVLPEADKASFKSELNVVEPLVVKIKGLKVRLEKAEQEAQEADPKRPSGDPLSRSVKRGYAAQHWNVQTEADKNRVDLYKDMLVTRSEIENVYKEIGKFREKAKDKYLLKNDAQEYLDRAVELINGVDQIIQKKMHQATAKKMGQQIIRGSQPTAETGEKSSSAGGSESEKSGSAKTGDQKTQELGQFLKKRFGL